MKKNFYENDFVLWTEEQVKLLKSNSFKTLDIENLIEEIESLGRSDKRALNSQITRLFHYLIKWIIQPQRRGKNWRLSIVNSRKEIRNLIEDSPSLKIKQKEMFDKCYGDAVEEVKAVVEVDTTDVIPIDCPWTFNQITNIDFWPEQF